MSCINTEKQYTFIHVPKTGGTSMEHIVGGQGHLSAEVLKPKAPDYFIFGFVRNPYDRLLSTYSAFRQHPQNGANAEYIRNIPTFPAFVRRLHANEVKHPRPHLWPQQVFTRYKDNPNVLDFTGRFEHIERDWQVIQEKLSVGPLEHYNSSDHKPWREEYTPELLQIVNVVYRIDFETFNYPMLEKI